MWNLFVLSYKSSSDKDRHHREFVLKMREPQRITESYFIAFIFHPEDEGFKPRYFVLEKYVEIFENSPKAVLCEWTEDEIYRNYMGIKIEEITINWLGRVTIL